jgi:hypothetical protein
MGYAHGIAAPVNHHKNYFGLGGVDAYRRPGMHACAELLAFAYELAAD